MILKISVFTIILLSGFNVATSQHHYYWAYGKKYPLEPFPEKQYIVMRGDQRESVAQSLRIQRHEISHVKRLTVSKAIGTSRSSKYSGDHGLHWGFVNRSLTKEEIQSSDIVYAAPSFRVNGKEVGLSQFFYVKLKKEGDIELLENLTRESHVEIVGNDKFMPLWYILSCDKDSKGNALEMANLFYETGKFSSAQPDLMEEGIYCTNDTFFNQQWHLDNTGQAGGTVGVDIRMCKAREITTGCDDVIVAVLDQGLEFNHPDFNNISAVSFDSETGISPATTIYGEHGVAVAGVIGATADNGLGVAGVAPDIQLMSINNSIAATPLSRQSRAAGINFAWQNGASVINNSWGSAVVYQIIDDAIEDAVTFGRGGLGTIVVFASGNESNGNISYPSSNANTIAVGAIGRTGSRASFSNYGPGLDLVAPRVEITTTDRQGTAGYNDAASPNGDYATVDGTSFAAPQVAGIAALMLSVNPDLTEANLRTILQQTARDLGSTGVDNTYGFGLVDAHAALNGVFSNMGRTIIGPDFLCTTASYTYNVPAIPLPPPLPPSYPAVLWGMSPNTTGQRTISRTNFLTKTGGNGPSYISATTTRNGCRITFIKEIHAGPEYADFSISAYPDCGSPGTVPTFVAGINGVTYNWTVNGGTLLGGQGTQSIWASMASQSMAVHCFVEGTSASNCYGPQGVSSVYVGQCWAPSFVTTSPNPALSFFEVELSDDIDDTEPVEIQLWNHYGTPVKNEKGTGKRFNGECSGPSERTLYPESHIPGPGSYPSRCGRELVFTGLEGEPRVLARK